MKNFKVFPNGRKFMVLVENTPGHFDYLPGNGAMLFDETGAKNFAEALNQRELTNYRNKNY